MNFYNKYILPKLINSAMSKEGNNQHRKDVASCVSGIVCEIGFGSGLNIPYYKNVTKLYALEPSQELYELAKEKVSDVSFVVEHLASSAESIPLSDSSVDYVVSTWSLCSIPHPEIALKEVFRILKSKGKFVFIEHGKSPRNFIAKIQRFLTPIQKQVSGGCHLDRDIEKLVLDAGFTIETIKKFEVGYKPLAYMYQGVALVNK